MREQLGWFDHAFGVVDRASADAIGGSKLLRELCLVTVRNASAGAGSQGRYLQLPSSYLRFLAPGDEPGLGQGASGVRISSRTPEALRELDAVVGTSSPPDRRVLSVSATAAGEGERAARDAAYAGWLSDRGRGEGDGLRLLDVATIEICAPAQEIAPGVRLLEAAGFAVAADGGTVTAYDGVVTLELRASESHGLRRIVFPLSQAPGQERAEQLGSSLLLLGPAATAVWEIPAV